MPQDIGIMVDVRNSSLSATARRAVAPLTKFIFDSYNNDLQFDASGKIRLLSGRNKLCQSILKILLTQLGEAPEDPDYGTNMPVSLGGKMSHDEYTELVDTVQKAVIHYNDINSENQESDEYVDTIDEIDVSSSASDPRILIVKVKMTNEAGEKADLSIPLVD